MCKVILFYTLQIKFLELREIKCFICGSKTCKLRESWMQALRFPVPSAFSFFWCPGESSAGYQYRFNTVQNFTINYLEWHF